MKQMIAREEITMKKRRTFLAALGAVCLLGALPFTASAALGEPIGQDDLEGATGSMTDHVDGTVFTWPYAGGENLVHIAKADDPASKDYVIEGSQSLYFINAGDDATADLLIPVTNFEKGSVCDFKADKTYVARFLLKQIAPFGTQKSNLQVIVRTWAWEDPWVVFGFKPDDAGDLTVSVKQNGKMYEKGAIQKIADDTYEVALRFNGVTNSTNCYLAWYIEGEAGFSLDGLKIYETQDNPETAFEKEALPKPTTEPAPTPETTAAGSDSKTTAAKKTTSAQVNASDSSQGESGGLSTGAIVAIAVAAVVLVACGVVVAVVLVKRSKTGKSGE